MKHSILKEVALLEDIPLGDGSKLSLRVEIFCDVNETKYFSKIFSSLISTQNLLDGTIFHPTWWIEDDYFNSIFETKYYNSIDECITSIVDSVSFEGR